MRFLRHALSGALSAFVGAVVIAGGANAAPPKALINADTVGGSPSQEEQIATAAGFAVTVVSDATWGAYTAADFGQYDLLIAGDPFCGNLPPGLVSSAATYGPVVLGLAGGRTSAGNRIVVGTDPVLHDGGDYSSPGARGTIIREGIAYAGKQPGTTGMYFDSTCGANYGGQSAETLAILEALSAGGGTWTIDADPPCGGNVALIASNPSFIDLTTASLEGWSCSVHESFPTFRDDWSALAVATDTTSLPTCGIDPGTGLNACGEAYILIAGSSIVVASQGISLSPLEATNPVGTSHTVTANVHESGGTPPVAGALVTFSVTGVNAGAVGTCVPADCESDVNGDVTFTYSDTNGAGDDTIKASFTDAAGSLQSATAEKHWVGGVACVPADCNDGNPCTDDSCDPANGCVNTPVPGRSCSDSNACTTSDTCNAAGACEGGHPLVCNDRNECTADSCDPASGCNHSTLPDGTACTGGDCYNGTCNHPPDCHAAAASVGELWPPNHKFTSVAMTGVTDPDGDAVTITITGIRQDEPINGLGDGDTCPDASGVGTNVAALRAERSGTGDGRVYNVAFTASDGKGGTCSGAVAVCVPHDQRPGHYCMNEGAQFDSTGPCS